MIADKTLIILAGVTQLGQNLHHLVARIDDVSRIARLLTWGQRKAASSGEDYLWFDRLFLRVHEHLAEDAAN